jgi:hypothetical protein
MLINKVALIKKVINDQIEVLQTIKGMLEDLPIPTISQKTTDIIREETPETSERVSQ